MENLSGKTAIVTGAGQGVGRGIALALASAGARLVVAGRTLAKVERTAAEIAERGAEALAVACDVGSREDVDAVVAQAIARFGRIDVLVNNAHTSRPMVPFEATRDKDMALAFQGFHGAFYFMQA